jgi:hypothetical protein
LVPPAQAQKIISAFPVKKEGRVMKYEYSFETKYHSDGEPILIMRLPQIKLVESFLFCEVDTREDSEYIWSALDDVINGVVAHIETAGNIYEIDITPTLTRISNQVAPEEEDPCEIETNELREIIEIWLTMKERSVSIR